MLRCLFHSSSVWVAEQPMLRPQELKDHMVVQHKAIKPFAPWHRDTPAGCPYTVKTVKLFRHYRVTCLGLVGQLFHPSKKRSKNHFSLLKHVFTTWSLIPLKRSQNYPTVRRKGGEKNLTTSSTVVLFLHAEHDRNLGEEGVWIERACCEFSGQLSIRHHTDFV